MQKAINLVKGVFSRTSYETIQHSTKDMLQNKIPWIIGKGKTKAIQLISDARENRKRIDSLLSLLPLCKNYNDVIYIEENIKFENTSHHKCTVKNENWASDVVNLIFLINKNSGSLTIAIKDKNENFLKLSKDFLVNMGYLGGNVEIRYENIPLIYLNLRPFL